MPAKPRLGQNFLNDAQAVQRIAASLGDLSGRTVVEIGPGAGAITGALAARAAHVLAVELDPDLAAHLRTQFPPGRVTVLSQNVLNFNFATALADFAPASAVAGKRLPVVGNLPYYITSQILLKLAASHASLDCAVLMVQREVADRIAAKPGSRDYGLLSVTVQMYGPAEKLFTLPPSSFSPPPDVHSTVFRWRFAPRFTELGLEEASFLPFVRKAFAQKRKTLANNLRAARIPPATVAVALAQAAIDPQARAEALPIEALAALWRSLQTVSPETERATPPSEAAPSS
jgi:16S rRNA (adenine1518-N6/adenine1519-N6)-dimethyltransferase